MKSLSDLKQEQALAKYDGPDRIVRGDDLLESLRKQEKPTVHFYSKLPKLDRVLGGFFGGQLIVVSGLTGQGKTTACRTFTYAAMEQGHIATWFSYELEMKEFLEQFPLDYVANIVLPNELTGRSPEWISMRSWESKLKFSSTVVFIDHLHFLVDLHKSRNISFDVGSVVRNLKLMALKHNLVVFLICHTMKTKTDANLELGLGDVRDSSLIEQEADTVLYVWRDLEIENRSILKIAKNRKKGIINKKISLIYANGRLHEEYVSEEKTGTDKGNRSRLGKRQTQGILVQ